MSTAIQSQNEGIQAYYDYLRDTADIARTLTERCILLEDSGLASAANLLRIQLSGMLDGVIDQQQANMPLPTLDS